MATRYRCVDDASARVFGRSASASAEESSQRDVVESDARSGITPGGNGADFFVHGFTSSFCPILIRSPTRLFHLRTSSGVAPYLVATDESASPRRTVWYHARRPSYSCTSRARSRARRSSRRCQPTARSMAYFFATAPRSASACSEAPAGNPTTSLGSRGAAIASALATKKKVRVGVTLTSVSIGQSR